MQTPNFHGSGHPHTDYPVLERVMYTPKRNLGLVHGHILIFIQFCVDSNPVGSIILRNIYVLGLTWYISSCLRTNYYMTQGHFRNINVTNFYQICYYNT